MRYDLTEPYAVKFARQSIYDSLNSHGEVGVVLKAYHPHDGTGDPVFERCSCYDDIYKTRDYNCDLCGGTSFRGGIEEAYYSPLIVTDTSLNETQGKQGVYTQDTRQVHLPYLPGVMQGDFVARVSRWEGRTPSVIEGIYKLGEVTQVSLRTGIQFAQNPYDVVGSRAHISRLDESHPIYSFDLKKIAKHPDWGSLWSK